MATDEESDDITSRNVDRTTDRGLGVDLTSGTVTVTADNQSASFTVHEDVLRNQCAFFQAALSECWKEGRARQVNLPEDAPEIVRLYLQWIYSRKLHIKWSTAETNFSDTRGLPEYCTLALLYVLGEKLGDVAFKDAVVDGFLKRMKTRINGRPWYPIMKAVDIVHKGTTTGSPLRQLMLDAHVYDGKTDWISLSGEENNKEFLADLARAMFGTRSKPGQSVKDLDDGRYHESAKRKRAETE